MGLLPEIPRYDVFLEKLGNRKIISLEETTPEKFFRGFHDYRILDAGGAVIGSVSIWRKKNRELFIRSIELNRDDLKGKGYGRSAYKLLQFAHLDHVLVSDPESMVHKTRADQREWDAVYLWEGLVREGLAIKIAEKNYRFDNPFYENPSPTDSK